MAYVNGVSNLLILKKHTIIKSPKGDLTLGTGFHGKPFLFALLQKYPIFIDSLERSDRAESGTSRTFEKKIGEVMTERKNWIMTIQYMAT